MDVPINSKAGVIAYARVSPEDYNQVSKHRWSGVKRAHGGGIYVSTMVKRTRVYLQRMIMGTSPPGMQIDHHDINPLNNCRSNLRFVTRAQNMQNRKHSRGSSQYIGVSLVKGCFKWISHCGSCHLGTFDNETDAARAYDIAAVRQYGAEALTNNTLTELQRNQFAAEGVILKAIRAIPKGVRQRSGRFQATIQVDRKYITLGTFATVEEAAAAYNQKAMEVQADRQTQHVNRMITRNSKGQAIIRLHDKQGKVTGETVVDDEKWHELTKSPWFLHPSGYAQGYVNNKTTQMQRLLCPAPSGYKVDHIDCDKLNNTMGNLRVASNSDNGQNVMKRKGCSSVFIGVYKAGSKWKAEIVKDDARYYLGTFQTEEDAARAYDAKAVQLFTKPRLNFLVEHAT